MIVLERKDFSRWQVGEKLSDASLCEVIWKKVFLKLEGEDLARANTGRRFTGGML